ncbi:MAG: YfjI family protein, partial [Acidimicrobiales bacterium]
GMSSGEGLIDKVRDATYETSLNGAQVLKAPGIDDKRMLVIESEFALVLRVLAREGNTLSAVVRNCWDGRTLQTMTKNTPSRATRPHISIIGHITADEMLRYLTSTELASGFINRFIVFAVRRSQLLPDGGDLSAIGWTSLTERLAAAVDHGRGTQELTVTPAARDLWRRIYPQLSAEHPGLFGAATARAEAHVVRLALLYALLDGAKVIEAIHLNAAHALWDYASRSTHWLFGDTLGDPVADDIWQAVRANTAGLTKSDIRDLFSRNKSVKAINAGIDALVRAGRLERATRTCGERGGRPAELFVPRTPPVTASAAPTQA